VKIPKGEVFRVVSSISLKHHTYHATNTGFLDITRKNQKISLVKDRKLGITILRTVFKQPEYHKTRLKEG